MLFFMTRQNCLRPALGIWCSFILLEQQKYSHKKVFSAQYISQLTSAVSAQLEYAEYTHDLQNPHHDHQLFHILKKRFRNLFAVKVFHNTNSKMLLRPNNLEILQIHLTK